MRHRSAYSHACSAQQIVAQVRTVACARHLCLPFWKVGLGQRRTAAHLPVSNMCAGISCNRSSRVYLIAQSWVWFTTEWLQFSAHTMGTSKTQRRLCKAPAKPDDWRIVSVFSHRGRSATNSGSLLVWRLRLHNRLSWARPVGLL